MEGRNGGTLKPFEKGQSGNIKGRPVGSKNRSTIARKWLEVVSKVKNPISGENEELSQEDIITLSQIAKARKGDTQAYKELLNSGYGLPTQQTDITSGGEQIKQVFKIGDTEIEI
jgi:hypothetical protein